MNRLLPLIASIGLMIVFLAPFEASAFLPIGGKVVSEVPCLHGGGLIVTVVGFGLGSGVFWYSPLTLTYLYGPPLIGEWILGDSDIPTACGERALMTGTSPL